MVSVNGSSTATRVFRCEFDLFIRETTMNRIKPLLTITAIAVLLLGLTACSGMSRQDRNTAIGAGAGAVGGSVLTGGSAIGTVGGAAIGGVIGHETSKP
jgi:osmotically inducible lipoprotein OsmB